MLRDFLTNEVVRLNVEGLKTPEEVIRYGGQLLMDAGKIKAGYIEAMINSFRTIGPYIVMAPGIAMPHARPSDDVLLPCISMMRLKEGVPFGHSSNDPVRLVFTLGGGGDDGHITILQALSCFLEKEGNIRKLLEIDSYEELEQLF